MTSIFRLFWRFLSAFMRSCWWKMRGYEIIASQKTQAGRMALCWTCPHLKDDACSKCECLIISKIVLASEKCPQNYWEREKVAK